jgi:iron complex transport system substrate-binding protein
LIAALFALLALGACGTDDSPPASSPTSSQRPSKIVSLSPTATEMLFAIGAGAQVIAVDDQSNYPPEAPKTSLSGYKPNVEAIAGFKPDLVVISDGAGELRSSLENLRLEVFSAPAARTIDDTYRQLGELGDLTGHRDEADQVVSTMKKRLAEVVGALPASAKGASYYHELDPTYFTATSKTFIGEVYSMLGLHNIADPADVDASGYPQLSAEFIVQADPDLIFLADTKCCAQSPDTVKARDGWSQLKAVRTGNVVALDDDIASRWGPRIVDFVELVAARLVNVEKAA